MPAMKPETRRARYQRAIDELIKSGSRKEAANRTGVSVGTIDRWHKDRQFLIMLANAQTEATRSITARVWNALNDATQHIAAEPHLWSSVVGNPSRRGALRHSTADGRGH